MTNVKNDARFFASKRYGNTLSRRVEHGNEVYVHVKGDIA